MTEVRVVDLTASIFTVVVTLGKLVTHASLCQQTV